MSDRFIRLDNRARNGEAFDDGEVVAAVDEMTADPLGEDASSAARAVESVAENTPERLAPHVDDLLEPVRRFGDPDAVDDEEQANVLKHALNAIRHVEPSAGLEVQEAVTPTIREGDPMLAAATMELFRAAVEAGHAPSEASLEQVLYRVGRSPNDYVMSVGGELLEAVVLAGGETAPDAFEAFGVLLREDQSDMTAVLGDRLVGLACEHEDGIPAEADAEMVGRALAERRDGVPVPEEEFSAALRALERVSGTEFDEGGSLLDVLPWR